MIAKWYQSAERSWVRVTREKHGAMRRQRTALPQPGHETSSFARSVANFSMPASVTGKPAAEFSSRLRSARLWCDREIFSQLKHASGDHRHGRDHHFGDHRAVTMSRMRDSRAIILQVVPEEMREWNRRPAPQAMVMQTNGKRAGGIPGPVPSMKRERMALAKPGRNKPPRPRARDGSEFQNVLR